MAKGNIGNLLQHFIALRVVQRLVENWNQPDEPIEYIDCYSMAPWELITGGQPQGFVSLVRSFPAMQRQGDFVASVFLQAWQDHYSPDAISPQPRQRDYPNTAVLLRYGFPKQAWRMRLHEDDSTEVGKNAALSEWARNQSNGSYAVAGDWTQSRLIRNCAAPSDSPVFVMLDPFQIVDDNNRNAGNGGYLPARLLRDLIGTHALNISQRPVNGEAKPLVVTLFSYANRNPEIADRIIREQFAGEGWQVERVQSGPQQGRNGQNWHVGWIVSTGVDFPILGSPAQDEWNRWAKARRTECHTVSCPNI